MYPEVFILIIIVFFRSAFDDWRPGLAQLLQPIPFPDEYVLLQYLE